MVAFNVIPPLSGYWIVNLSYAFCVCRYEGTIAGQFFGHSHYDEFEILYDTVNTSRAIRCIQQITWPSVSDFIISALGPSITPYQSNNPSYRIYEIEGLHNNLTTFQLIEHHTYFADLAEANANNNLNWQYEYGAKVSDLIHRVWCHQSYGLKTLHPQDWSSFVDEIEIDNNLFDLFMK